MKLRGRQKLVRIFVVARDQWKGRPLAEAIVDRAWKLGLAGATVFKASYGYGCKAHVHDDDGAPDNPPLCIEIVDTDAKIKKLLPHLDEMVKEGLVTVQDIEVLIYRTEGAEASRA